MKSILFKDNRESLLFRGIEGKTYLKKGEKPPEGVQVKTGSKGGKYFEDEPSGKDDKISDEYGIDGFKRIAVNDPRYQKSTKTIDISKVPKGLNGKEGGIIIDKNGVIYKITQPVSEPSEKDVDFLTRTNEKEYEDWQENNEENIVHAFLDSDKAMDEFSDYAAGEMPLTDDNFFDWGEKLPVEDVPEDFKKTMFAKDRIKKLKEPVSEKPKITPEQTEEINKFIQTLTKSGLFDLDSDEIRDKVVEFFGEDIAKQWAGEEPKKPIEKNLGGNREIVDKSGVPFSQDNNPEDFHPDDDMINDAVRSIHGPEEKWYDLSSGEMDNIVDYLINDHYTITKHDYRG